MTYIRKESRQQSAQSQRDRHYYKASERVHSCIIFRYQWVKLSYLLIMTLSLLSIFEAKQSTDDLSTHTYCEEANIEFFGAFLSSNLQPQECTVFTFGSSCIIENDSPSFIISGIKVKNSSRSIEECLGIMTHTSHNTYKLVDSNRLIVTTAGILI